MRAVHLAVHLSAPVGGPRVTLVAMAALGALALGALMGALVNALADRVVGVDEPIWRATQCRKCGAMLPPRAPLALRELAPRWRRQCVRCGQAAPLRGAVAQVALALLTPLALWRALIPPPPATPVSPQSALAPWALFALAALALGTLAFIFVVDLEHRLIYDLSIYPLAALLLAVVAIFDRSRLPLLILGMLVYGALFLLLYGLGWLLYRQEALGLGDVKLAALLGLIVGWPGVLTALFLAAVGGAIVGALLLASGSADRRAYIPFGVFMAGAATVALLAAPLPW